MSDFTKALVDLHKNLDGLAPAASTPKTVAMTKDEAIAYIKSELQKASEEKDETKAKKRVEHLRGVVALLTKASWESTERATVTIYEEPDLTVRADQTETETAPAASSGKGTQEDGSSFAAAGGAQSFAKGKADKEKEEKKTKKSFFDGLLDTFDKILAGEKIPNVIDVTPKPDTSAGFWPSDVNTPAFLAEGVTKRAGDVHDWGNDPKPAASK